MLKDLFIRLWKDAYTINKQNILNLADKNPNAKILDLGCDDGVWTIQLVEKIGSRQIFGLDLVEEQLVKASQKGILVQKGDLNKPLLYEDNLFDVVHTDQVIEHLFDVDTFISEIYRILKPGGYALISTENLSAWHNLFALLLGFQAFSQHISTRYHIGNPLSPHTGESQRDNWTHVKIFTYFGFKALLEAYSFKVETILGAGYYPFWGILSRFFSRIDACHTHYITIKARKPL